MDKGVVNFAVRWGKLMQAEMKQQGLDHLTPELIEDTRKRANIAYGTSGAQCREAECLLAIVWKHGVEFATLNNCDVLDVALQRALKSDKTKEFADKYNSSEAKNFDEAVKKGGQVIATILPDERLIHRFRILAYGANKHTREDIGEIMPALKLPDNNYETLCAACNHAFNIVDEIKHKTKEGNTK